MEAITIGKILNSEGWIINSHNNFFFIFVVFYKNKICITKLIWYKLNIFHKINLNFYLDLLKMLNDSVSSICQKIIKLWIFKLKLCLNLVLLMLLMFKFMFNFIYVKIITSMYILMKICKKRLLETCEKKLLFYTQTDTRTPTHTHAHTHKYINIFTY